MSKQIDTHQPEQLLPMATEALAVARIAYVERDVSPEMDEVQMVLKLTGLYPQDLGSTGMEIKNLRIEGLLNEARVAMGVIAANGSDHVAIAEAHVRVMNLHEMAKSLARKPPMLPKPHSMSPEEVVEVVLALDPFQADVAEAAELVSEDAEGDFGDVTAEETDAAARPLPEPLTAILEPLSRRRVTNFFGSAADAKLFGLDIEDDDLRDPTEGIDQVFAEIEGGQQAQHAAS